MARGIDSINFDTVFEASSQNFRCICQGAVFDFVIVYSVSNLQTKPGLKFDVYD